MNDIASSEAGFEYRFRPRLIGSEIACILGAHSLDLVSASGTKSVAYPMIERVRLSYRPNNMSMRRYLTEIWPRNGSRIELASVSFLPNLEVRDHAPEYKAFVRGLHEKIKAARSVCRFEAGFPAWRWWPLLAVGLAAAAAAAIAIVYALMQAQFLGALILAAAGGFFLWQVWALVTRNRPRVYAVDAIPEQVLPK